jgi:cell division inhibitor SepF
MSAWKKAMSYLGLGPEDAYDDYDAPYEPEQRPATRAPRQQQADPMDSGAVRTIPVRTASGRPEREREVSQRPSQSEYENPPAPRRQGSAVRAVPSTVSPRPTTIRPTSFNQAQEIADRYKDGQPVIMNLEGLDRDISRRLIDFASGLCYGLGGSMEKVGSGVYLLTPVNASVSMEERRMMGEYD